MKNVSRFISVVLCICAVLSSALFVSAATYMKDAYGDEAECSDASIALNTSAGIRLGINGEFSSVSVRMSTYLRTDTAATVKLYKWSGSYDETLDTDPIVSQTFDPVKDNQKHTVRFKKQSAGEYLVLITNDRSLLAIWKWKNNSVGRGYTYFDGVEEACDINVSVGFTSDVSVPFYAIEPSETSTGDGKAPPEYVPDENSAVVVRASHPTTWAATDELGRTLPTYEETGGLREGKTVALFYWSWHVTQDSGEPFNLQKFMEIHPEVKNDYNSSLWPKDRTVYFWNESVYGYYKTNDAWVLRKHAELLADAGVDVIIFDNTNGTLTFKDSYDVIFKTFAKALEDGVNVPKISFILPFWDSDYANIQVRALYNDIFKRGKYQKLWFYFDGKPMLMCDRDFINTGDALGKEIKNYFTYRKPQPSYTAKSTVYNQWGWLSVYPQTKYRTIGKTGVEEMTVGVAINHNYVTHSITAMNGENVMGRTYTSNGIDTRENAVKYGANFAEQFEYALQTDPSVIFITGWNEWIVGRYDSWNNVSNAFPDEFNDEFSRDIEPSKGALRDNYYYQMVSYIRRFKGCEQIPTQTQNKSVNLGSPLSSQWDNIETSYIAYADNVSDRDAKGYGSYYYKDESGRNDIVEAKVSSDNKYVYFLVKCADNITPNDGKNWMNLYIDTDDNNVGWESFDFVIGKKPADKSYAYLQRFNGNGYETEDAAKIRYAVNGEYLVYAVSKEAIGITARSGKICFKWTDNVQDEDGSGQFKGEILDFYRTGDVAPGGRFKYVYSFDIPYAAPSGDVNRDGEVDNKDTVELFRYVSGGAVTAYDAIYDYNEDGYVNNKDVTALFRFVSTN